MTVNIPLYCAADYVFQSFAGDGDQRDGSIDLWLTSVAFLVDWNHMADFHSSGMMPWSSEAWKKRVYIGASSDASSFNSLAGSGSGPEALCGSMPANSL